MVGYFDLLRGNFVIYFKFIRFKSESWRVVINILSFNNYMFIDKLKKPEAVDFGLWRWEIGECDYFCTTSLSS